MPESEHEVPSFYDVRPGDVVFPSPTDLAAYKAHFDVLLSAFGPTLDLGQQLARDHPARDLEAQIAIAEEYLARLVPPCATR